MITLMHTESSKGWGGQENRTLHELVGLKQRGVKVLMVCQPDSQLAIRAREKGIEVRTVVMRKSFDLPAVWQMMRLIKEEGVDIVNTHSGRDSILAGLAGRLSRLKPRIVRTRHLALPITSRLTYSVLPHRVVAVSEYVRQYLVSEGVPAGRVSTVRTGVDLSRFNPEEETGALKQELGLPETARLVGTIAILRIKKGHQTLIAAIPEVLAAVPEAVFVFAGNGPQLENIQRTLQEKNLAGHVILLGLRKDIPHVLKSLSLFVLPTLEEALGTSYLEAMAMKLPVIGTRTGGVPEVVRDGENGLLVEPNDPAGLAGAIIRLLNNPAEGAQMGERGQRVATTEFSVDHMCEQMLALHQGLLES